MKTIRIEKATCTHCSKPLPAFLRDANGNWDIVDCTCGEWYDTWKYEKAGGKRVEVEY